MVQIYNANYENVKRKKEKMSYVEKVLRLFAIFHVNIDEFSFIMLPSCSLIAISIETMVCDLLDVGKNHKEHEEHREKGGKKHFVI